MKHKMLSKLALQTLLLLLVVVTIFPYLWMISSSFKYEENVFDFPIKFIPDPPTMENYEAVFSAEYGFNFIRFFYNSSFITGVSLLLQLLTSLAAGYAFARLKFPGRSILFVVYLSNLMIPVQGKILPLFFVIRFFGLIDNPWGLILPGAYAAFGVFLLRQFCLTVPYELSESAKIDGLGNWGILLRIILPNVKPALATLTIFSFVNKWNDFMLPLVFLNSKKNFTLTLGIKSFMNEYAILYGKIMAGTVISLIPVILLYVLLQRYFIQGVATSGLKG